jgi:hypothetical protein
VLRLMQHRCLAMVQLHQQLKLVHTPASIMSLLCALLASRHHPSSMTMHGISQPVHKCCSQHQNTPHMLLPFFRISHPAVACRKHGPHHAPSGGFKHSGILQDTHSVLCCPSVSRMLPCARLLMLAA